VSSSQFITLGVFMLVAFRMGAQPLAMPSKAQVSGNVKLKGVADVTHSQL